MKTVIVAILAIFIFRTGSAQITITTADMPVADKSITLSTATVAGVIDTSSGANKTWDYSGLSSITQTQDTFFSKGSMPLSYQAFFLTSNLGERAPDFSIGSALSLTNSYNIYKNSNAGFEQTAAAGELNGVPIPIYYTPADVWYKFPLHYGDTATSNSAYAIALPSIGSFSQQRVRKNDVVGWGSLKLPMGMFNVLLVRSVLYDHDSIYVDFLKAGTANNLLNYQYKFIGLQRGLPLLEIDVASVLGRQQVTSITYHDTLVSVSGIPVNEPSAVFSSFPNPAVNIVRVITNYGREIKMVDMVGRTVFAERLNNRETDIDVASFSNGIYFISVNDHSGNRLTRKLIIQH